MIKEEAQKRWRILENSSAQKVILRAPLQVRQKYEFWKEQIEDEGPMGVRKWKGFYDHLLKGEWRGYRSSYLNRQYRVIYRIEMEIRTVFVEGIGPHNY